MTAENKSVKIVFKKIITVFCVTNTDHAQRKPLTHIFNSVCCTELICSRVLIVSLLKVLIWTWWQGHWGGGAFVFGGRRNKSVC